MLQRMAFAQSGGEVDRLTSMTVFAKVAAIRSFSGAARELGISQATASKHVQTLEEWLGARLLHRTTRRVALTDAGENFFNQCSRILEDMEAARNSAKPEAPVRGSMRITAPIAFGSTRLGPIVVDFLHQHPELSLSVELTDRSVDLIEEGYDLAIRTRPTDAAGLVAWPLAPLNYVVCAAPSYLARHGVPGTPAELGRHHCITNSQDPGRVWRFSGPTGETEVPIHSRLQANNAMLRCDAARAGAGVLLCAEHLVASDIAKGSLLQLLPDYAPAHENLHAVSPSHRATSPKVRSLVNHLATQLGG
jgi:DNA-binding transcriptional LysR family regulator